MANFSLITHAVPAERVRRLLPEDVELQTFKREGIETGFVSCAFFFNENFRWDLAALPRMNFFQSMYRAYVTYRGLPGVYFFKNLLGTLPSYLLQRSFCRESRLAAFDFRQFGDAQTDARVRCGDGFTHFSLVKNAGAISREPRWSPFENTQACERFFTHRMFGFFQSPGGVLMNQRVSHRPMTPSNMTLETARFEIWERLGILQSGEAANAFAVHAQPRFDLALMPPLPAHSLSSDLWQRLQPAF